MRNRRAEGASAEDEAASYLLGLGYAIVTRRFKAHRGEIDLIALDGDVLVFVEVKMRKEQDGLSHSMTARKRALLREAASEYLAKVDDNRTEYRFDFVGIHAEGIIHEKDFLAEDWG